MNLLLRETFPDFLTPLAPADKLSDSNLNPLTTHPEIKYVARSPCCDKGTLSVLVVANSIRVYTIHNKMENTQFGESWPIGLERILAASAVWGYVPLVAGAYHAYKQMLSVKLRRLQMGLQVARSDLDTRSRGGEISQCRQQPCQARLELRLPQSAFMGTARQCCSVPCQQADASRARSTQ